MARLSTHEYLVNVVAFLSSNVVSGPGGILPSVGVILRTYNYEMKIPELEELQGLLAGRNIPDVYLVNKELKTLLVVECKTDIEQEEQRSHLNDQIKFFLSEKFLDIMKLIYQSRTIELVILTYQGREDQIIRLIQKDFPDKNIIVWTIPFRREEHAILRKVLGKHGDSKLNSALETSGIDFDPPVNYMLIDPTLSDRVLACRILVRLLNWHVGSGLVRETGEQTVTVDKFKEAYMDWIGSIKRLKDIFRYIAILAPELGKFDGDKGCYTLNPRPNITAVLQKEKQLQNMSDDQFQMKLHLERMPEVRLRMKPRRLRPTPSQAKLPWGS